MCRSNQNAVLWQGHAFASIGIEQGELGGILNVVDL